jgi:hypothetical protein
MENNGVKALFNGCALDPDVKRILKVLDGLLEKLPEDEIEGFSKSREYEIYQRVLKRYGVD